MSLLQAPVVAMGAALSGSAILSLGLVLQKRHVAWLSERRYPGRSRDAALWVVGFVLMNVQPVFVYFALAGLAANVVAAAGGASVAFTALLSVPLLGERLTRRRIAWTVLLFAALAVASLRGGGSVAEGAVAAAGGGAGGDGFSAPGLYLAFALPALAVAAAIGFDRAGGIRQPVRTVPAAAFAAGAGAFSGFMVLAMDGLRSIASGGFSDWLRSPFLYLYVAAGIAAFAVNQIAYGKGSMASVAPAFYGMQVLWPAICAYFVSGAAFDALQALSFVVIALSILAMGGEKAADPGRQGAA